MVAARRKPSGESEQARNAGTGGLAPSRYQWSIHFQNAFLEGRELSIECPVDVQGSCCEVR